MKQWVLYVKTTIVSNNINYKDIPGFLPLVKAVLLEMKEREVAFYPEALRETTCAILSHEKMLNVMVYIVFKKTNVYDT